MRIAILCPASREAEAAALADDLRAAGADVALFCGGDGNLTIAEAFGRAGEFDLIHNLMGPAPLACAGLVSTPVVTTLFEQPSPEALESYQKLGSRTHYVAVSEAGKADGLDYVAVIEQDAGDAARKYMELYGRIMDMRENYRPWGHYENLVEDADHKMKRIVVAPEKRLSLQKHARRAERWVVIRGEGVVTLDGEDIAMKAGDTVFIPKGAAHRMTNPGGEPLVFGEVQLGDYFDEDDIIRLEDDFGRTEG